MTQESECFGFPQEYIIDINRLPEKELMVGQPGWAWPHVELRKVEYAENSHQSMDQNSSTSIYQNTTPQENGC